MAPKKVRVPANTSVLHCFVVFVVVKSFPLSSLFTKTTPIYVISTINVNSCRRCCCSRVQPSQSWLQGTKSWQQTLV